MLVLDIITKQEISLENSVPPIYLIDFLLEIVALFDRIGIIIHGNILATENQ